MRRTRKVSADEFSAAQDLVNANPWIGTKKKKQKKKSMEFSSFSIPRELESEEVPTASPTKSNFYISPREVINFLDTHPELFTKDMNLDLGRVKEWFDKIERGDPSFEVFPKGDRTAASFNTEAFLANEYKKMCYRVNAHKKGWLFPNLIGPNRNELSIPTKDVFDLPVYIMLYILRRLTRFPRDYPSFTVSYTLGLDGDDTIYVIPRDDDYPVSVINGTISPQDLQRIYMTIIRRFAALLPDSDGGATWNGSEDSGTRVVLLNYGNNQRLHLKLVLKPTASLTRGHGWSQKIEDFLKETVGSAVLSVRNHDDNKCLIYCIIMGVLTKLLDGSSRLFGVGNFMIEDHEIFAKAKYYFPSAKDAGQKQALELLYQLSECIVPSSHLVPPQSRSKMLEVAEDVDKKAGTMISVADFRAEFAKIEAAFIPEGLCGIDVYGIDYNISRHIYPLYISKTRKNVIELLCVTPQDTRCSHYCLITNMEKLLRGSGGKQFFSCSKCGQAFYHRRLLNDHHCPYDPKVHDGSSEGTGGYHYSWKYASPETDVVVGSCTKCRLDFVDQFRYEYHMKHCLMSGQTGFRHVQLASYDPGIRATMEGEVVDDQAEERHLLRRRVLYADFESCIDPETGVHTFMSYGVYDSEDDTYKTGEDLHEFLEYLVEQTFADDTKDQTYVYFHNAMGYDANFILRCVLQDPVYKQWGIQVIMKSSNRLQKLVFHVRNEDGRRSRQIHIGDTFLFLTLSLEKIVGCIRTDDIDLNLDSFPRFFKVMHQLYPFVSLEMSDHILRKNIFPYRFFTSPERLNTDIDAFLSIFLPNEENLKYFSERVTVEDLRNGWEDTRRVMKKFHCKTARDYHNLYLCCDVMQLADVFSRTMDILWESHHIHLTRYLGMPSASWAAFLRHDPTMAIYLYEDTFFAEYWKEETCGGITAAPLRYANVKDDPKHVIIYLDVNGLYPFVMQKYKFPMGDFQYVPCGWEGDEAKMKLASLFNDFEKAGNKGMSFCVDMHFPDEVKRKTDMYPFAPEHRKIYEEYYENRETKKLTPFLERWSKANDGESMKAFEGLVCTLYDKKNYNVHWRLLKFYIEHGVEITKVHYGVSFTEGDYLKGYIRKNIEIRNTRSDELGKTVYKLLGNSVYGKTFESPFKRNTFEVKCDPTVVQRLLEEGSIAAIIPIDELGWIIRMDGEDIILDKPTYIGACVCEFAKLHMYTLLYDKLCKIFPDVNGETGCQLVYTDTDSFIVKLRMPEGMNKKHVFDYIRSKDPDLLGKIGGQVKSETGEDATIEEIIALRSKVYCYKTTDGHIGKRAKGTTHDAQEMQLDWDTYKKALETLTSIETRNVQFVRKVFKISSVDVYRQSLSVNDGKRYICQDGIHTHAFGYPLTSEDA